MHRSILASLFVVSGLSLGTPVSAQVTYSGIVFPQGEVSFADRVVTSHRGREVQSRNHQAERALGPPVSGYATLSAGHALSLGEGGFVILEFTDNSLTTSGDGQPDLHIFEIGQRVEVMQVDISQDGQTWISLGQLRGQPTSIDIDGIAGVEHGGRYSFVRIRDVEADHNGGNYAGADIDAVGAISSAPPVSAGPPLPTRVHGPRKG